MQDLIEQERFELEVLDRLNSMRLLKGLVFTGGTMLRLCYGLGRFSVDLDFWQAESGTDKTVFSGLRECLSAQYNVVDATEKFYTILFEIRSHAYPRALKIEVRKEPKKIEIEKAIAFSPYSSLQVLVPVVSLKDMMDAKIAAFLDRKEIRDVFDMEFLLRKGVALDISKESAKKLSTLIDRFKKIDYTAKLGSLLDEKKRRYYSESGFKLVKSALAEIQKS